MSRFFIERPVFSWVIAIIIMLAGVFAIETLPIEQYPKIAPPSVVINASYPGASAETLENSVTQVIEQNLTGIDNMRYFSASSDSSGNMSITVTFEQEADPDIAQVQVQNKVQGILSSLPQIVQQNGVTVNKSSSGFLLLVGLYSEDGSMNQYDIGDYINSNMVDPISRVVGVGDVTVFGQEYSMRIWLNPEKMHSYGVTASDVISAVESQNADIAAGQLGGTPSVKGQQLNATITAQTKLSSIEEFENILLKVNTDGSKLLLKDVATMELGAESYDIVSRFNGRPASGVAVSLASGANALDTADHVKEKVEELAKYMPDGLKYVYPYDTTPFVKISIEEVVKTLLEAIVLVFLVMFLFLQNFRATLIPTIAVPVVLLGTFGVLSAFGFSINTLTMFAMVLAVGLLVDDAIVVVENVERLMSEEGLPPKEATKKSMDQITGALIGIALVLSAVFVPMAFFSGSTGVIYRQFSITIVSAMALSVLVAIILTPALCSTLLKPVEKGHQERTKGFFGWFNRNFNKSRDLYKKSVGYVAARAVRFILLYGVILAAMIFMFTKIPTSFLPDEDQGIMMLMLNSPAGSTMERTRSNMEDVEEYFLTQEKDNIISIFTVTGFSFAGQGQNTGLGFVKLKDWEERPNPDQSVQSISSRATQRLWAMKDAMVFVTYPPAITELGRSSGFNMQILDRGGQGHEVLVEAKQELLQKARQNPKLTNIRFNGLEDVPQYKLDLDIEKAKSLGISVADIIQTLGAAWGSEYINDFTYGGRIKKVYVQGAAPYRMLPEDINKWYIKNSSGEMVSFEAFSKGYWKYGPPQLARFNGVSSMEIQGGPVQGVSSGEAMDIMAQLVEELPGDDIDLAWSGISYEERAAGSQTTLLYALSLLIVFLCLAALYESWSIPFAVILIVPLGIVGAVAATLIFKMSNDVYFQVGLLTTIGLASKNAILIVEFAKSLYEKGHGLVASAMMAAQQRLRPIIMTSMAFILGVTPLATSSGAGSASQNAIGIGVIGGMFTATFLAILFVPMFFILIENMFGKKKSEIRKTRKGVRNDK
ncbi:transporter, hydrophobe/amphiphile efflux-1 (HAE1) family [Denitrovibrio acetiphilus DSM 12809]|uniref:Transporter, hydrophobe/amphiphile efflux-1 (HAE1) family n=1 Tax=Denitrovibrio acetiphilus (strain DSM 12809 / NBRC 114555 / N2460) TaxID=522772 RepID=D4H2H3_DENA2|nr:efflux RND transporter permease subunit [Denitrovibrio acetiphilus]ADD67034.1 transporter, hydrophobe/amphiphile efflux-1 (HAE1) family [Denitrovibrio acetiphilus DSM 12809]